MNLAEIQSRVNACIADTHALEDLHELLAVVAERNDIEADPAELERGGRFVLGYVEQVPYMMKVAATAAANVGLESEMDLILERVSAYWLEDVDIIPDHMGVIGLLDDAYCSMTTLQAVSDHFRLHSGKYLFPDNLTAANRAMRKIIGEPYVEELDRFVSSALNEAGVVEALTALASPEKQRALSEHATIWNHGRAGEMPIERLSGLGLLDD